MKSGKINRKISLSRKVFQYLLGVAIFSLILLSFFWIEGKLKNYHKEVVFLKKTFSESKKSEIRNKILQVKDYINWVRTNPVYPLSQVLTNRIRKLKLNLKSENITKANEDSIRKIQVPIYLINARNKVFYATDPFRSNIKLNSEKDIVLEHFKKTKMGNGLIPLYMPVNSNDSVLTTLLYYDTTMMQGVTVASMIDAGYFKELLQQYVLDSLSRLRYAKDEYVFINSYNGKALVSDGRYNRPPIDIFTSGDTAWIRIFKIQQLFSSQPGGFFYTYTRRKISTDKVSTKTSFFSYLPEWKWIIGTGFYEDDFNSVLASKKSELYDDMRKNIFNVVVFLLISTVISYLIGLFFSRRLDKNIEIFKNFFAKAAVKNTRIDQLQVSYEEFESMAEAANFMVEEREKAEEEIQKLNQTLEERVTERTAQLVAINKELESFSYSISHDLRAPLRAIYGFSQILSTRHRLSLNDEGRQYMDYIVEASIRMEKLINDLLNYSRLGGKSLDIHPISLAKIVNDILADFKPKAEEIGAIFIVDKELPVIKGDESLFRQIFTNLIENAITYRRNDVQLEITISCNPEMNGYMLKISDNGIGISSEYWEKIFSIFQRLHSNDKYPGTGIGLATVRKAVSLLDGAVWVESVVGKGSVFFIHLPEYKNMFQYG